MKITKKRLNKLIDERVERQLRRYTKKEQALKKQLEEVCAVVDSMSERPRSSGSRQRGSRQRFEEYDD